MAGGRAYLLHCLLQRCGLPPGYVMSRPPGERALMFASMQHQLEQEAAQTDAITRVLNRR